ncbi:MAG TPA: class I SAM-dependent methyltransferase [Candidatus Saccharimonadales bacterium]|nr:class I SAM-dependent methyltransferase [Candidatus Saccharimonadales bacterium]
MKILMGPLRTVMEKTFGGIYQNHRWFNGSGSGSLPENTEVYRDFVQDFIDSHDIKSVIDLGCGDWQSTRFMHWDGIQYFGIDVVPDVIEENRKRYKTDNIHFASADITHDELPEADLVIIKDVLQHWPNEVVMQFLKRLEKYKYVLITNTVEIWDISDAKKHVDISGDINRDIELGDGRALDISKPPFNFPVQEVLRYPSTKRHRPVQDIKTINLFERQQAKTVRYHSF